VPGCYFFEPLLFVDRFAPFFVPFRAPFFFVGIVSTLRKRCWWCGAMRARNHLSRTIESAIRAVKEAAARTTAIL